MIALMMIFLTSFLPLMIKVCSILPAASASLLLSLASFLRSSMSCCIAFFSDSFNLPFRSARRRSFSSADLCFLAPSFLAVPLSESLLESRDEPCDEALSASSCILVISCTSCGMTPPCCVM